MTRMAAGHPMDELAAGAVQLLPNRRAARDEPYGAPRSAILNARALQAARDEITGWPGYAVTPLHELPGLAERLRVASVHYKDEGSRFGLGSFKALGGAYAVGALLCREISLRLGRIVTMRELVREPALRARCADFTVTCATDGNHGRSVAWGARLFGCRCVIYIHAAVSEGRRAAIERFGASVVRTEGNYDEAVQQADADARRNGWHVISDTSYPGSMDVPRDVMQGYQLMVDEAGAALPQWPTHVFVQAGVGGCAAAVCAWFWERDAARRPTFVVVEPDRADCLLRSARAGQPVAVTGALDTLMAGLACGEISLLAWEILERGADAFCSIPDEAAVAAMKLLARPGAGDTPIVAGESAVAGVAAAIAIANDPALRDAVGLHANSRVLFFGTESDTDPKLYRELVGASGDEVAGARR